MTLRFIDAGEGFPAERPALARSDERFDVDPLAESGRGLRLILRAVDYFNVETRAGENVTTLIKALPDAGLRHSTDGASGEGPEVAPVNDRGFSRPRSPASSSYGCA